MTAANLAHELVGQAVEDGHVGVVAGVVSGEQLTIASGGRTRAGGDQKPNEHTLFRIASLSKVFTGVALAAAVLRGELALSDTAQSRLPAYFRMPSYGDDPIRIEHLATHTSGLPRGLAGELPWTGPQEYAAALARVTVEAAPGSSCTYSNLGGSLVGLILTAGLERSYDSVLAEALGSLSLPDVIEHPNAEQRARVAPGHDQAGLPCETPTYPLGVASGGLYGTVSDLLRFLRAHWAERPADALRLAARPRTAAFDGNEIGLFWLTGRVPSETVETTATWHNGGLPGYRSFLGFLPERRAGVVVLSNTAKSVDDLGAELLAKLGG